MPLKTTLDMVQSHWCQSIGGLQLTPSQFYDAVTETLKKRQLPGVEYSRVEYKESVLLGAERQYLRVQRGRIIFDICAAPYGVGSFVSSWMCIVPTSISLWHLGAIASAGIGCFLTVPPISAYFLVCFILTAIVWWMFCQTVDSPTPGEDIFLGFLGLGPLIVFFSQGQRTYYQIDTAAVFLTIVQEGVTEVIDGLCTSQNVRPLTELERKPSAIEFRKR